MCETDQRSLPAAVEWRLISLWCSFSAPSALSLALPMSPLKRPLVDSRDKYLGQASDSGHEEERWHSGIGAPYPLVSLQGTPWCQVLRWEAKCSADFQRSTGANRV